MHTQLCVFATSARPIILAEVEKCVDRIKSVGVNSVHRPGKVSKIIYCFLRPSIGGKYCIIFQNQIYSKFTTTAIYKIIK